MEDPFIIPLKQVGVEDVPLVGGKNASLGEMLKNLSGKGINVPDGFAVTVNAYWDFIHENRIRKPIEDLLTGLDRKNYSNLKETGSKIRELIMRASLPDELIQQIVSAYNKLGHPDKLITDVAVRSSATAEDLPSASFAGQHDSFLNISGETRLLIAVQQCFASLFNDRAIKYREDRGFDHMKIGLSVGVQKMVRSDLACSGIGFTLEPGSGFRNVIHIAGVWGLGENIVQGIVNPDEALIFKPSLINGKYPVISKKTGSKSKTLIYAENVDHEPSRTTVNVDTPLEKQKIFVLNDDEIIQLGQWALLLEEHYKRPMDFEWAKDGITDELFVVQARPETVHSLQNPYLVKEYELTQKGKVLLKGNSVGHKIVSGKARIVHSLTESDSFREGEILVTENTNPDWNSVLKKAAAIITNKGGRTSHASIVARELGIVAVVGTENGTEIIKEGQLITVACHEGKTCTIYDGTLDWKVTEMDFGKMELPVTKPMLISGDPDKAFQLSFYPSAGIGLMRLEFIISNVIKVHPMALVKFNSLTDEKVKQEIEKITGSYTNKKKYFVDTLSQAVATMTAAFFPREVIVRMSDFKTNEYAGLIGGKEFEPEEENPMIGFRGASRYYHPRYREGFELECMAMKRVRNEMGLTNVKLMIPFCRTVEEGKKVIDLMEEFGLKRGDNGLEIYVMTEIPSNVLLADEFAKIFDGFSIGSNDLTQLTLGIDRDNEIISDLFSEQNKSVTTLISSVIASAKRNHVKIGLCGQAPSDYPEFANFLVNEKIDSISFNPDALLKGIQNMIKAEKENNNHIIKTN